VADQELDAIGGVGLEHRFKKAAKVFGFDSAFSVAKQRPFRSINYLQYPIQVSSITL